MFFPNDIIQRVRSPSESRPESNEFNETKHQLIERRHHDANQCYTTNQ